MSTPSPTKRFAKPLKNDLQPHQVEQYVIPPEQDAEFVYRMVDVLDLYHDPYDGDRPVACFDESMKLLHEHVRGPSSAKPGTVKQVDHHYERNGSRNLFMISEPLVRWRHVEVTERRTKEDWVDCMQLIADELYPDAECIRIVMDNLNTHDPTAFYDFLPQDEAQAYLDRFEVHFTLKHGSWLNMVEIEFSALKTECLDKRIPDESTFRAEVTAWYENRNEMESSIDREFTPDNARTKLRKLCPVANDD